MCGWFQYLYLENGRKTPFPFMKNIGCLYWHPGWSHHWPSCLPFFARPIQVVPPWIVAKPRRTIKWPHETTLNAKKTVSNINKSIEILKGSKDSFPNITSLNTVMLMLSFLWSREIKQITQQQKTSKSLGGPDQGDIGQWSNCLGQLHAAWSENVICHPVGL